MLSANKLVNILGKYMYKNIDGAYKFVTSSNMCDVYFTLLYQLRVEDHLPTNAPEENDVHEMTIDINITTYQNKIRVNIIEMTPEQRTLGHDVFTPDQVVDVKKAKDLIYNRIVKRVTKAYRDFNFLF